VRDRLIDDGKGRRNGGIADMLPENYLPMETPKLQSQRHGNHPSSLLGTEPIADFFPNTSVLFADIAGFTAWSSTREPSQVFALLETLYGAMDKAARKLGVFKVGCLFVVVDDDDDDDDDVLLDLVFCEGFGLFSFCRHFTLNLSFLTPSHGLFCLSVFCVQG
jgi:Adenylate and Guanylate cyclase catalytic domain